MYYTMEMSTIINIISFRLCPFSNSTCRHHHHPIVVPNFEGMTNKTEKKTFSITSLKRNEAYSTRKIGRCSKHRRCRRLQLTKYDGIQKLASSRQAIIPSHAKPSYLYRCTFQVQYIFIFIHSFLKTNKKPSYRVHI